MQIVLNFLVSANNVPRNGVAIIRAARFRHRVTMDESDNNFQDTGINFSIANMESLDRQDYTIVAHVSIIGAATSCPSRNCQIRQLPSSDVGVE